MHPPIGLNLYVTARIAGESTGRVMAEMVPMYLLMFVVLAYVTYCPAPLFWLPNLLGS